MAVTKTIPGETEMGIVLVKKEGTLTISAPVAAGYKVTAGYLVEDDGSGAVIPATAGTTNVLGMALSTLDNTNGITASDERVTIVVQGLVYLRASTTGAIAKDDFVMADADGEIQAWTSDVSSDAGNTAALKKRVGRALDACDNAGNWIRVFLNAKCT